MRLIKLVDVEGMERYLNPESVTMLIWDMFHHKRVTRVELISNNFFFMDKTPDQLAADFEIEVE